MIERNRFGGTCVNNGCIPTKNRNIVQKLIVLIVLFSSFVSAQEARPKIGVALSGGGARGLAHIGVLQWFEEHRIPIDYIAGTSMGGLVGGLYATGMTPEQLQQTVDEIDWQELFRPVPPYATLSFRRKEDRREFPNHLELGLKGGLRIPPSLNSGHSIGLLFDRLTLPYSTVRDFDDLPIPFRCLATDMVKAELVVISRGPLASALQATMAIPGVFSPIEMDGKVFVSDGGLLKNIPTDTVEEMGADVVIVVDIGTPLGNKESLQTLRGVLGQTISVMMQESGRRSLDPRLHPKMKAIIAPELQHFETFDFDRSREIIKLGYRGAGAKAPELMPYSLNEDEWRAYIQQKQNRIRMKPAVPEFVQITAFEDSRDGILHKRLDSFAGKSLSPDELEKSLNNIWGLGRYSDISYSLIERDGKVGLAIVGREKVYAPPFLNLGLELNNTDTDDFDFNFRARATFYDVLMPESEIRFDASMGSRLLLGGEYYKRVMQTSFFFAPYAFVEKTKTRLFSEGAKIAEYEIRNERIGVDFGYVFGSMSELRLGYAIANASGDVSIGDPVLPDVSGKHSEARLLWQVDTSNSAVIPSRGLRTEFVTKWIFDSPAPEDFVADTEFPQLSALGGIFFPIGAKNTAIIGGEGSTSFGYQAAPLDQFTLGGLLRVSGLNRDEFRGNHLLRYNIMYVRTIGQMPPLFGEKISAGVWYEGGSAFDDWEEKEFFQSFSAGLVMETLVGPVFFGGSFAEGGRRNFFFAIGRIF